MNSLAETLADVRGKIAQYQGREVNEQDTKTAIINPVLRALGWEVGNLEEVSQEYRKTPKDNPVDYACFLLRAPKLFVEAKALGHNLNDHKWISQIVNYGNAAGVKWTVITNGDEYRIYNACVDVPLEEKLFRCVRISDPNSAPEETLALLSKDRISDIESLWEAHFMDHRVRAALEQVFSSEPHPVLMRLVKRMVKEGVKKVSSKEIRASLARVRARFDFPIEPGVSLLPDKGGEQGQTSPGSERARKAWKTRRTTGSTETHTHTSLREVIDAGLLKPPLKLTRHYKGTDLEAELLPDGSVCFHGETFKSLSASASVARGTVTGRPMSTNGWTFWCYQDEGGKLVPLDAAWEEYLKRKAK